MHIDEAGRRDRRASAARWGAQDGNRVGRHGNPPVAIALLARLCSNKEHPAMASPSDIGDTAVTANDQIRQLRDQVDQLMRERVTPIISDAAGRAQDIARQAQSAVTGQAEAVSSRVRDMPLTSVLIAAAVGYLLGRVTR
jgi:ElaB/YqjD/DUF883 family membrane-anchored ribosome-binding protein